jgi:uncharacterized integral membrane protein
MFEKHIDDLKTYVRADYARKIAAENRDKPIGQRWRLIRESEEHKHRLLFARSRATWILIIGASVLLAFYLAMVVMGVPSDAAINPTIGSYRFPDSLVMLISIVIGLTIGIAGWCIGTKRARERITARQSST